MGMAFPDIAASHRPSVPFTMFREHKLNPQEFSFYLGREKSGTAQNSELTLGGRDASKYKGDFTKVPITKKGYWQVAVDGVVSISTRLTHLA